MLSSFKQDRSKIKNSTIIFIIPSVIVFFYLSSLFVCPVWSSERYINNGDGTVRDTTTGLIWAKTSPTTKMDWVRASGYCSSNIGGYTDWRVPRVDELITIVDYERYNSTLDPVFEGKADTAWDSDYWTTSSFVVDFYRGIVRSLGLGEYYIRCLRSGPHWPPDPFYHLVVISEDTVEDTMTNLRWQRADDGVERTWNDAKSYCEGLSIDGFTNWRMPTIKELNTIIDYTTMHPSISTEVFECSESLVGTYPHIYTYSYYWSNSIDVNGGADYRWYVDFQEGRQGTHEMNHPNHYVRCVCEGLPPIKAEAGSDKIVFSQVTLDGSQSYSDVVSFQWQLQHRDNSAYNRTAEGEQPTIFNLQPGFYDVVLTVKDDDGLTDTDSMLLAVVGSTPFNSIELVYGWNLVGYNSYMSQSIADALTSISGKYVSVWAYVNGSWKVYDPNNPGLSDLTTMEPGYGYWINAAEACTWTLP